MLESWTLAGKIVSGVGQAAFFTQLAWVQEQCEARVGFRPYPGTLNIEPDSESEALLVSILKAEAIILEPPDPQFCVGRVLPASIGGIEGALIIPEERVNVHGARILEIMAPVGIKDALGLNDGDRVALTVRTRRYEDAADAAG